jgi:hypothetical protein
MKSLSETEGMRDRKKEVRQDGKGIVTESRSIPSINKWPKIAVMFLYHDAGPLRLKWRKENSNECFFTIFIVHIIHVRTCYLITRMISIK